MFGIFLDVTQRKQAEEGHELLAGEMSHRVKNLLAIATSLTNITSRSATSIADMTTQLTQRLTALGRAHDVVRPLPVARGRLLSWVTSSASCSPLMKILLRSLGVSVCQFPHGSGEGAANTLALIIHELATNSVKHGALSVEEGSLDISSTVRGDDVVVVWAETGGPVVQEPAVFTGYGSKMVARSIAGQLQGGIGYDWQPSGLVVTLRMKKDSLSA